MQNVEVQLTEFFRLNVGRKFHLLQSFLYFMPVGSFSHNFRMDCPRDKFSRFYFSVVIDFLYNKKDKAETHHWPRFLLSVTLSNNFGQVCKKQTKNWK